MVSTIPGTQRDGAPLRWAVIGGGLLGLRLADHLAGAGHQVTVYDNAPTAGGLASSWQVGDVEWDRFYHVTLLSDAATRRLYADLGLDDACTWVSTKTGCYADGALHPLTTPFDWFRFPALNLIDKGRLAGTILWGARIKDWKTLEGVPVRTWLERWSGRRVFQRFWLPLLKAKLGDLWPEASAAFIWATIQRLYKARRSGLSEELFGYVPGGWGAALAALGARLEASGVEVRLDARVAEIRTGSGGDGRLVVRSTTGTSTEVDEGYDHVVVTTPPPAAARMLTGVLATAEVAALADIRYQGVVCTSVVLSRPLSPYYLTYLTDDVPMTAIVEMTTLVDPERLGGRHLVYLPRYVTADDPLLDAPDEEIEARFLGGLRQVHPDIADHEILAVRTARARQVFPVPTLGYSERVPGLRTRR